MGLLLRSYRDCGVLVALAFTAGPLFAQNSYEAEAPGNSLAGTAAVSNCSACSGGQEVTGIGGGSGNYLIINNVQASPAGAAMVTISYLSRGARTIFLSVNGGPATSYSLSGKNLQTPVSSNVGVSLNAGPNTIKFFNNAGAAPNIDRIVVTGGGGGFGLLSNGLRDKTLWPFASNAVWNTAIGSGAVYQPAGIVQNSSGGSPTAFDEDGDVIVMMPSAPATNVYYNGAGWSGGNRCPSQGSVVATVPLPANYTLANSGQNNSAAFLLADGQTIAQNQPFTRCSAGGHATTLTVCSSVSIYGTDPTGCHGGSGLSDDGGTIRVGEFTSGQIQHVMKVELWAANYYYCCTYHWPAIQVDGYASPSTYGGTNPNFGPGALLALPPGFNANAMTTIPGKVLAQAFQNYGAYVADDTSWNAWALAVEQGPNGAVWDEFSGLYGFSMTPAQGDPFLNDVVAIFRALQIVTNNSQASVGGGGVPRVPSPPAIGN